MKVQLCVRNESQRKRLYRTDALRRLAERVCIGEGSRCDVELSVLLCDDAFIRQLNRRYCEKNAPTDVLAFGQPLIEGREGPGSAVLGDIVISLETVERHCAEEAGATPDRTAMRQEVYLLFCHGLLHLLGSDHATAQAQKEMDAKQARYLGTTYESCVADRPQSIS